MLATGCSVQFGCQNHLELPFLHVFGLTINGPKDAKMWPLRGFALHPKDALPTGAAHRKQGFPLHHCCQNCDRRFELPPNGSATHTMHQRTFQKQHATHKLENAICTTQHTIHNTQHVTHNMQSTTWNTPHVPHTTRNRCHEKHTLPPACPSPPQGRTVPRHPLGDGHQVTVPPPPHGGP